MATSGQTTLTYTRDQYIEAALRKTKIISRFEAADPEDIAEGAEALNLYLATISDRSDGAANAKMWLRKTGLLIQDGGKNRFTLGGSSSDLAVIADDFLAYDIESGALTIQSTSPNSISAVVDNKFTANNKLVIHYDEGGSLSTNIDSYNADDNILDEPDFDATGNWVTGTGWSIGSGKASCDGTQTDVSRLYQVGAFSITTNSKYLIMVNVSSYTSGSVSFYAGAGTRGTAISETGWNVQYGNFLNATTSLNLEASADFVGEIDSVIVVKLTDPLTMVFETNLALPANKATEVFLYKTLIDKPLEIITMNRRDRSGTDINDMPMQRLNESQYEALADKNATGDPTSYYYEEKLDKGYLYLDSITTDRRDVLVFKYISPIQYFTSSTDELDIPDIGREMIVYNLAKRLAAEHNKKWSETNEQIRIEATARFMNSDPENIEVFFEPDRVDSLEGEGSYYL